MDWQEWIPMDNLVKVPEKAKGSYGRKDSSGHGKGGAKEDDVPHVPMEKIPSYWLAGRVNLMQHYQDFGTHWSDSDGIMHEVGHLPRYWAISLNGQKAAVSDEEGGPIFS